MHDWNNVTAMTSVAEWTLYEQVAIAAMDCQRIDIAKVLAFFICSR